MHNHRSTQVRLPNDPRNSNFEAATALENLRAEVVHHGGKAGADAGDNGEDGLDVGRELVHGGDDALALVEDRIADRAAAYGDGMKGVHVDGNDPIAMYGAARDAVERARAGDGPTLIEAMTYRFHGHVFGDDDHYMDKAVKAAASATAEPDKADNKQAATMVT